MTKNSTCIESASHNLSTILKTNQERSLKYKSFAVAFSYPDDNFFSFYPKALAQKEELSHEYDRLFRANDVWLYGCEYVTENEFQRAQSLADINGFYRAFGLEPDKERPDSLTCELEFMHYLILKELKAPNKKKRVICLDAENKFFYEHLYPAAKKILGNILSHTENNFYKEVSKGMFNFLESEKSFLKIIE